MGVQRGMFDPEKVMALLNSKQFDVVYDMTYRGSEIDIERLIERCERLREAIACANSLKSLEIAVVIIDACILSNLPTPEIRSMIATIINRSPELISQMPHLSNMLERVYRAVAISLILDPKAINRVIQDVREESKARI